MLEQIEIAIPVQPSRVTLGRARNMRNELEKSLAALNPDHATAIAGIALRWKGADAKFHQLHMRTPSGAKPFQGKRALEQLYEIGRFIAALEEKGVRNGAY